MPRSLRLPSLAVLVAFLLVASARGAPAFARPTRVALVKIDGDTAGLGKAVVAALDDSEIELVAGTPVSRAIERLGLGARLADRDVARLAGELEVDAVVKGAFERRAHRLRFTIFAIGKKGKPFTVAVGNAKSEKFRAAVRKTLLAKVAAAVPKPKADDTVADDNASTTHKAKGDEVADAPLAKRQAAVPDDGDDAPARPRVAARDEDDPSLAVQAQRAPSSPGAVHSPNLAALRVDLGGSMAGRRLQFDATAFPAAPRPYSNAPVPGARFAAELYPLALRDPTSLLAGLGIAAEYDQTIALTLHASEEMTVPLKATERHYAIGARFRLAFGHRPTSPTLTLGAGYAARTFTVDRSQLMSAGSLDLPDVDYRMFDPGVALRLPLGSHVALTLAGQALLVTSAGPIQRSDQYGAAGVLGGAASAGLELIVTDRVALRLAAEATQLSLAFHGSGTLATSRDGDSSTVDVRGATDRYYGGAATLAVTY